MLTPPPADPRVRAFLDALADAVAAGVLREIRAGACPLHRVVSDAEETRR